MEDHYKSDVDNWLCNLYFEIDKIRLSEIKIHKETKELYHRVHRAPHNHKHKNAEVTDSYRDKLD
jgi:hypothetical protein